MRKTGEFHTLLALGQVVQALITGESIGISRGIRLLMIIVLLAVMSQYRQAAGQSQGARQNVEDLFRKAGISKSNQGATAADFLLRDVNGNTVSLSGHRGNLVFLNFWATWCGPCRQEMPSMERLYQELGGQGLAMLAVNQKESGAQVANFMRSHQLSFAALLDSDGRVSSAYRVWGLPATYLIDGGGRIIGMQSGAKDWASRNMLAAFKSLLKNSASAAGVTASLMMGPVESLPASLRVKTQGGSLYAQQDAQAELVAKVGRGEEVVPMGKALSAGEAWYMIKNKSGAIGWMKGSDLEEAAKKR